MTAVFKRSRELVEAMDCAGIREIDLEESFIRSAGPGGQKVNKTSSCVALKHIPTGIMVKCQEERSQNLNRIKARWILIEKVNACKNDILAKERQRMEKLKRQSRKKPRELKEKILKEKKVRSELKQSRKKFHLSRIDI